MRNREFYSIVLKSVKDNPECFIINSDNSLVIKAAKGQGADFYKNLEEIKQNTGATNTIQWKIFSDEVIVKDD